MHKNVMVKKQQYKNLKIQYKYACVFLKELCEKQLDFFA